MALLEREPLLEMFSHPGWAVFSGYLRELREVIRNQYQAAKTTEQLWVLKGQEYQINRLLSFRSEFQEQSDETSSTHIEY